MWPLTACLQRGRRPCRGEGVRTSSALALDRVQSLRADGIAQATLGLIHPHEREPQDLREAVILPDMVYINRFNTDGEPWRQGSLYLIGPTKGDMSEAHLGPFRCNITDVL